MKKVITLAKNFGPAITALVIPVLAFAQAVPSPVPPIQGNVPQGNITSLQGVLNLFCVIFSWAFYFLIALAVIFVLVAAFKYLTAGGDPEKVKAAGSTLLYAAVAIGVALLARAVPLVIGSFLGAGQVSSC
jgi:hypothetical protein